MDENDDVVASWTCGEDGHDYELRVYDNGCQVVLVHFDDEGEGEELLLAGGLAELDETIRILTEARNKIAALPEEQQEAAELDIQ